MRHRQAPKLKGSMRKVVLALVLVLACGCATPDRFHDLRTRDPVMTRPTPWVIESVPEFLSVLARLFGPESGKVIY